MKSPSIRRSLLVRCGIGVGALLCALSLTIYLIVRQSLYREMDLSITQTAALLANQVGLENDGIIFEWQEGLGTNNALIFDGLFQFWNDTTGKSTRSPALQSRDLPKFRGENGSPLVKNIHLPDGKRGRAVGLRVIPFILPGEMEKMKSQGRIIDPKSIPHTLVVAGNLEPLHHTLDQLRYVLFSGSLLTLALGFTLIDHVIRITLRPINELTRQMHNRAEHQLDSALTLPGRLPWELTGLTKNFDSLLARVATTRRRERDFIRHAAHELRTPIAGLRATTELALSQPRDAASCAAYLTTCRQTAEELGELVNRLSALARIGSSSGSFVKPESLSPSQLIDECLPPFRAIIESRGIDIIIGPSDPDMRFTGDRTLSRIILNNLLDNAACYTPDKGVIRINCERSGNRVLITISNPAADLTENTERLFEPLFRRENSAFDGGTHLGIGLTLSLDAANAMGGTLKARKTNAGWIEFVFGLPSGDVGHALNS
jgi:two-component system sensor histidine kinase QseC